MHDARKIQSTPIKRNNGRCLYENINNDSGSQAAGSEKNNIEMEGVHKDRGRVAFKAADSKQMVLYITLTK